MGNWAWGQACQPAMGCEARFQGGIFLKIMFLLMTLSTNWRKKGELSHIFFTPKQKISERYVQLFLANFGTWSGSLGLRWCELRQDTLLLLWWSSYESYGRSLMILRAVNDILLNVMN